MKVVCTLTTNATNIKNLKLNGKLLLKRASREVVLTAALEAIKMMLVLI